jgi:hypothetical protein
MDVAGLIDIPVRCISHEISNSRQREACGRSATGCHQTSFENFRAFASHPQTGRRDVRPNLRCAIEQGCADLEAVPFGKCRRPTGFDRGDRHDNSGSEEHGDRQCGEGFEHLGVQTLVAHSTAFGGSLQQQPNREMVPVVQLLFVWRVRILLGLWKLTLVHLPHAHGGGRMGLQLQEALMSGLGQNPP